MSHSHVYYLNVKITTLSNGYLGSRNDEERSEMRYVMRIAEFSESSNLWTQIALLGSPRSTPLSVSVQTPLSSVCKCALAGEWESNPHRFVSWNTSSESHILYTRVFGHKLVFDWRYGSDVNTDPCGLTFTCNFHSLFKVDYECWRKVAHVQRPRLQSAWMQIWVWILIWDEARQPPEFKHINKGRKRN